MVDDGGDVDRVLAFGDPEARAGGGLGHAERQGAHRRGHRDGDGHGAGRPGARAVGHGHRHRRLCQLEELVGGVGEEQVAGALRHGGALVGAREPTDLTDEVLDALGVRGHAGLLHREGVAVAVARQAGVADDRHADGEALEARQATGVVDHRIGRGQQPTYVLGPSEGDDAVLVVELLHQGVVAAAEHHRHSGTGVADRPGRARDVAHAPRPGDDEDDGPVLVDAEQLAALLALYVGGGLEEGVGQDGTDGVRRHADPAGGLERAAVPHREVLVDALVQPQAVHVDVGEEADRGDRELALPAERPCGLASQRVGRDDDVVADGQLADLALPHLPEPVGDGGTDAPVHLPVQPLVGARGVLELPGVEGAVERTHPGGQHLEVVVDLRVRPAGTQAPLQLVGHAVVPGAHGRRDDEHGRAAVACLAGLRCARTRHRAPPRCTVPATVRHDSLPHPGAGVVERTPDGRVAGPPDRPRTDGPVGVSQPGGGSDVAQNGTRPLHV